MNRRRLLAGIGSGAIIAMSGCLEGIPGVSGSQRTGSDDAVPMTLSLSSVDSAPEPLSFEVSVSDDQLTTTEMPILEVAVKNTGTESVSWSYAGGVSDLPFQQGVLDSETGELVIGLREEVQAQLLETSDGCSRVDHFDRADGIKNTVLKPGTRIEKSYAIAGVDGDLEGNCPEPSEYRMEQDIGEYGEWGFEFQLE